MFRIATVLAGAAVAFAVASAPAQAATTFNFGGTAKKFTTGQAFTQTQDGYTVSATAWVFNATPAAFQTLAQGADAATLIAGMTAKQVARDSKGIGVCWSGEAANQCNQVDADGVNELLRITISEGVSLISAQFDRVDNNDTLKLYGVTSDGKVEHLGYGGIFDGPNTTMGLNGVAGGGWVSGTGEDQVYTVTFDTTRYREFWFGNNNDSADGYRLDSITIGAVPEPATWALMIGGFGMAGAALRRRRVALAA